MAWTTGNPVSVGNPTKKKDYDKLWDNVQHIKTNVMSSGTVMLFGQNSPPTGWTRKTGWTPGSGFTNIVYSTGNCSTGGATPATTDLVFTQSAHSHQWYDFVNTGDDKTWNAAGGATAIGRVGDEENYGHIQLSLTGDTGPGVDYYTNSQTPTISKTTAFAYIAVIAAVKDVY